MELLYDLEYKVNEMRKERLSAIQYKEMSVKDFLDLGFDSSLIEIESKWYDLGYKWHLRSGEFGYESTDFGELNENQLNCMVKYVDDEINDYNYQQVSVELVNKEDSKYFIGEEEE